MKYIKQIIVAGVLALYGGLSSCNFLNVDEYFMDTFSYDSVFANKRNIERYLWNIPTWFGDEAEIWFNNMRVPGVLAADETIVAWDKYTGRDYTMGLINSDNSLFPLWLNNYKIVRKTNMIFKHIDQVPDITLREKTEMIAYAHFMRGYAYMQLLENFGPLLIQGDELLETNEDMEYYDRPRSTYDESVEYVCKELELAAQGMPDAKSVSLMQFGRPHRDAALAMIARVRLIHASNAFNGGTAARRYFNTWKRSTDNVQYVSQTPDNKRWAVAAYAASRLMDGTYKLHTVERDDETPLLPSTVPSAPFPDGAGGIDPYKSYKDMFSGETVSYRNPEIIWGKNAGVLDDLLRHTFPKQYGGWNGLAIPQKVVDAYRMADGTEYMNAHVDEHEKISGNKTFSGYQLRSGTSSMYDNREMRFYASIGFSGRFWAMNSTTDTGKKNKVITYELDGNNGKTAAGDGKTDYPISGYTMVKYIHDDDAREGDGAMITPKAFPIIRYAEILLAYAEALNEIEGSHTIVDADGNSHTFTRNYAEIKRCFNQVRYRAGLPGIPDGLNRDQVFELIVQERMVEFLHENRRYYDVRRWGIYEKVDTEPIMGMDTDMPGDNYYNRVRINHLNVKNRITSPKMVFLPIWKNEIRKMTMLDQNPGWDD